MICMMSLLTAYLAVLLFALLGEDSLSSSTIRKINEAAEWWGPRIFTVVLVALLAVGWYFAIAEALSN